MADPTTRNARRQLQALEASQRWADADRHLARGEWAAAIGQVQALAADLMRCHRALGTIATRINRRHWSPLLSQSQPEQAPTDQGVA